jgi:hypothetical protein
MIFWKNCTIMVYKTGEYSKTIKKMTEKTDGEAFLPDGISVLCEGGPAKEV